MSHPSVSLRFRRLLEDISPTRPELERVNRNVTAIRTRLNATFGVVRATVVGSHKKGTAIRTYSDVDVFVVLQRMEARWGSSDVSSTTLLKRIRDDLQARYPATAVRRDEVAVVVGFGSGEFAVDVVPALFDSFRGRPIFRIPDGGGGWMPTAPDAQLKWLRAAHAASARRLIPVVRMLKWWSCTRAATASFRSTYLEALLGCENVVGGPWSHAEALARAFSYLARSGLSQVADPAGISSDSLAPTRTPRQRATLLEAARSAAGRSTAALAAERAGDWRGAIRQWSIIFNYQFPE
ncbi:MAG TPA: nucleotidyltransferase domain-containing protein [Gemmatimonadaceae bacterium]|nr:nucleotidyltransferase domain-containing protein [Gemmatimonadaceae bacterium]